MKYSRPFSRSIPSPRTMGMVGCIASGMLVGLPVAWLVFREPELGIVLAVVAIGYWVIYWTERRRLLGLTDEREGENICSFARSFATRSVDPWIIRAAWEEFQPLSFSREHPFPLRRSDTIMGPIVMLAEGEDLFDSISTICERVGRAVPHPRCIEYGLETVGDAVHFVNALDSVPGGTAIDT
ncbi:MAG: hypothetical protein R2832_19705 [Rhodothermales bacterium]